MKLLRFLCPLLLLPSLSNASYAQTTGFRYNDDVVCAYPFDEFLINDITCDTSSSNHIMVEGVNDNSAVEGYEEDVICHYGDHMEIEGEVTTMEAVSKKFDVYLHLCFKTYTSSTGKSSTWTGSSGKKCYDFHTNLDLSSYTMDRYQYGDTYDANAAAENAEYADADANQYSGYGANYANEYEYRNQNYDFLPAGTYKWKAFLTVPIKSLSYRTSKYAAQMPLPHVVFHTRKRIVSQYSFRLNSFSSPHVSHGFLPSDEKIFGPHI